MEKVLKNRKFVFAVTLGGLFNIGANILFPYLNPFLNKLGMSPSDISFVHVVSPLFIMLVTPIMGVLLDRLGKKRVFIWASLMAVSSIVGLLFLNIYYSIISAVVFFSLYVVSVAVIEIIELSSVEGSSDGEDRGLLTGIYQSIRSFSIVFGMLIGVLITSLLPLDYTFIASFFVFLGLTIFSLTRKKDTKVRKKLVKKDFNPLKDIKSFLKDRRLKVMGILGILTNFSEGIFNVFIPLYIINELHGPLYFVGLVVAARYIISILQFYYGKLCDIKGSGKMVFFGIALKALALALLPFADSLMSVLLVSILISIGGSIWNTSAWCYMSEIGEDTRQEGMVVGSYMSVAQFGPLSAYITGGLLFGIMGTKGLLFIAALTCMLSAYIAMKNLYSSKND